MRAILEYNGRSEHEAHGIKQAIDIIERLVPPSSFVNRT